MSKLKTETIKLREIVDIYNITAPFAFKDGGKILRLITPVQINEYGLSSVYDLVSVSSKVEEHMFLKKDDIIIKRLNSDYVAIFKDEVIPSLLSSNLIRLRCKSDKINPRYLAYLLESTPLVKNLLKRSGSGSTITTLTIKDLGDLDIPILCLGQQEAIGNLWETSKEYNRLLNSLKIENNKLLKSIYKNIKQR